MKKRIAISVLALTLFLSACEFNGVRINYDNIPNTDKDTSTPINSIEDLSLLRNSKKTFKLMADLDFADVSDWSPINGFTGELLGQDHSITNFNYSFVADDYIGFFGTLEGKVKDLTISGTLTASGGCKYVGLLAGKSTGAIENVKSSGSVTAIYSKYVGGVVGHTKQNIKGCENNAVIVGLDDVGGVAGYVLLEHNKSLTGGNDNKANVTGQNKVGGVIGEVYGNSYSYSGFGVNVVIPNCNNSGKVTGNKDYIGGVAGYVSAGQYGDDVCFSYCSNSGVVTGVNYVSGIVGGGTKDLNKIEFCENTADITGTGQYVGGYVGGSEGAAISVAINNNNISGGTYVGGIAGKAYSLSDCENKGQVTCTDQETINGALVARFGGVAGSATAIDNCTNTGALVSNTMGGRIGGVAGELTLTAKAQKVDGNKNAADITCQGGDVGGVFGYVYINGPSTASSFSVELKRNQNSGVVKSNSNRVGGIAGQIYSEYAWSSSAGGIVSFNTNTNTANITGFHYVGGLVGCIRKVNDDENIWMTNTQTGTITATAGDGTSGNYYGIINN